MIALAAAAFLISPAVAQTDEPALKVVTVDSSEYPSIDAIVTVPKILSGQRLDAGDWVVLEDGEPRPVDVRPFDPAALEVAVVLDSTLEGGSFLSAQGALMELPVHLSQPTMSVVSAGATPVVALAPTRDTDAMSTAIHGLESTPGPNALEDGLTVALNQFSPAGVRRAVVVVTDELVFDPERINQAGTRARRDGVAIFVVSLGPSLSPAMEQLAYMTGGASWKIDPRVAPLGVVPAIDEVVGELRGQYQLVVELTGDDPEAPVVAAVTSTGITAFGPLRYWTRAEVAPNVLREEPSRAGEFLVVGSIVLALATVVAIFFGLFVLNARHFLERENILKKRDKSEDDDIGVLRPNDLQTYGQTLVGEPGTNGARRGASEVEGVGEEHPVRIGHSSNRSVLAK
jgi:hypothetical protein